MGLLRILLCALTCGACLALQAADLSPHLSHQRPQRLTRSERDQGWRGVATTHQGQIVHEETVQDDQPSWTPAKYFPHGLSPHHDVTGSHESSLLQESSGDGDGGVSSGDSDAGACCGCKPVYKTFGGICELQCERNSASTAAAHLIYGSCKEKGFTQNDGVLTIAIFEKPGGNGELPEGGKVTGLAHPGACNLHREEKKEEELCEEFCLDPGATAAAKRADQNPKIEKGGCDAIGFSEFVGQMRMVLYNKPEDNDKPVDQVATEPGANEEAGGSGDGSGSSSSDTASGPSPTPLTAEDTGNSHD